ncbi:MAG: 1-acyl-sn-glycerol-3-phosphate acyltransferase [Deltaproteobacteria bacterium]|nr:1-acyl-sn-glycerol-3-phosphate acyltransferase [Deltaproteobacteria bacterium]
MMPHLRVLVRAPVALAWTLGVPWWLRVRGFLLFRRWRNRRATDLISLWARGLAWIMGVRVVCRNPRPEPMGEVIVANHLGFLDVPVLGWFFPAVFIIKMEMRRVFYFGSALQAQGHVFVDRGSSDSRRTARDGVRQVLEDGDRIIVFPEGGASAEAVRPPFKPFCFHEAARQNKLVQACVIDYLPHRSMLRWDVTRPMLPQLVETFGRRRTEVSLEFFPAERIEDPDAAARRYHDLIERKLLEYDREAGLPGRAQPDSEDAHAPRQVA